MGTQVGQVGIRGSLSVRKKLCKSSKMVLTEPGADVSFLWWGCLGPHVACGPFIMVSGGTVWAPMWSLEPS